MLVHRSNGLHKPSVDYEEVQMVIGQLKANQQTLLNQLVVNATDAGVVKVAPRSMAAAMPRASGVPRIHWDEYLVCDHELVNIVT